MAMLVVSKPFYLDTYERGSHDCQKCKTRRIRCDRLVPSCWKCRKGGFNCPGSTPRTTLKWNQGIASRGRLKGHSTPVYKDDLPSVNTAGHSRSSVDHDNHISIPNTLPKGGYLVGYDTWKNSVTSNSSPIVRLMTQSHTAQLLLHHYSRTVSTKLPWIDCIDNPWRTITIPMAMESPFLCSAILSIAAEDLALTFANLSLPNDYSHRSEQYREQALKLLTSHLAEEIFIDDTKTLHSEKVTSALATVLLLCNLEMRRPQSTLWRIHLRAARALIRRYSTTDHLPSSTSFPNTFLIQKFFSLNVFAFMSSFGDIDDMMSDVLPDDCSSIFIEFLRIMHSITQKQRSQRRQHQGGHYPLQFVQDECAELRRQFDHARERTRFWSTTLKPISDTVRRGLENVLTMFYYAGLIYGHRMLTLSCCSGSIGTWRDTILHQWQSLGDVGCFSQDLLWPLFIAGTEMRRHLELQQVLEKKISEVFELSGHWNGLEVMNFLSNLWEWNYEDTANWVDFAVCWIQQGNNFLII